MTAKREITITSPAFDIAAKRWDESKKKEKEVVTARREEGDNLLAMKEIVEKKIDKGRVTHRSEQYTVVVDYKSTVEIDVKPMSKLLTKADFKRIFPSEPKFSQSAFNAWLKQMTAEGLHDEKIEKYVEKILASLKAATSEPKEGAPQISVISAADDNDE